MKLLTIITLMFVASCGSLPKVPPSKDFSTFDRRLESAEHRRKIVNRDNSQPNVTQGLAVPFYFKSF